MWLQLPALCGVEDSQQNRRQVWPRKWKRRHHRHDQTGRRRRLHCSVQRLHGNGGAAEGKRRLGGGGNQRMGPQGALPSCHAAARPPRPFRRRLVVIYFKNGKMPTLITKINSKSLPEDQMNEYFPAPSSESLTSEYFVPARFLLKHHRGTSFDDLKAGLSHLQRKVGAHKEGQLSFLKVRAVCFFVELY